MKIKNATKKWKITSKMNLWESGDGGKIWSYDPMKIVMEEIADQGTVDRVTNWESQNRQPKELSEGELININEEKWFWHKGWSCPRGSDANK